MNILFSASEKHPNNGEATINVFGLARRRGHNVVYVTRMTDALSGVLTRHGLIYYTAADEARDGVLPWRELRAKIAEQGSGGPVVEFIGMPWNVRQELDATAYKNLVNDIAQAITDAPSEASGTAADMIGRLPVRERKKTKPEPEAPIEPGTNTATDESKTDGQ